MCPSKTVLPPHHTHTHWKLLLKLISKGRPQSELSLLAFAQTNSTLFSLSSHFILTPPQYYPAHLLICLRLCPSPRPAHCALWNPEHGISRISSHVFLYSYFLLWLWSPFCLLTFIHLGGLVIILLFVFHIPRVWRGRIGVFLIFYDSFQNELWALHGSVSSFSGSPAGRRERLPPTDALVRGLLWRCAPSWSRDCLDATFPFVHVPINILEYVGIHRHSHVAEYLLDSFIPLHLIFCPSTLPQLLIFILILQTFSCIAPQNLQLNHPILYVLLNRNPSSVFLDLHRGPHSLFLLGLPAHFLLGQFTDLNSRTHSFNPAPV